MLSRAACAVLLAWQARAACPPLASLRSPAVSSNFSAALLSGPLWFENRFSDLAQLGARCQRMNKSALADGANSFAEVYEVFYGDLAFPLPLLYNGSGQPLGVSSRSLAALPEVSFPSVVMDVTAGGADGAYDTLIEYLCWEIPLLNLDYVEVRLSTRQAAPPDALLDAMEARMEVLERSEN